MDKTSKKVKFNISLQSPLQYSSYSHAMFLLDKNDLEAKIRKKPRSALSSIVVFVAAVISTKLGMPQIIRCVMNRLPRPKIADHRFLF